MCGCREYPSPPHGGPMEVPRGRGDLNNQNFSGKNELELEFPEGFFFWGGGGWGGRELNLKEEIGRRGWIFHGKKKTF